MLIFLRSQFVDQSFLSHRIEDGLDIRVAGFGIDVIFDHQPLADLVERDSRFEVPPDVCRDSFHAKATPIANM